MIKRPDVSIHSNGRGIIRPISAMYYNIPHLKYYEYFSPPDPLKYPYDKSPYSQSQVDQAVSDEE